MSMKRYLIRYIIDEFFVFFKCYNCMFLLKKYLKVIEINDFFMQIVKMAFWLLANT